MTNSCSQHDFDKFRDVLDVRITELDRRLETATQNIKESTNSSFAASQKAIDKQENFQTVYNSSHNDLSRQMKEQYAQMVPRTEFALSIERIHEDIKSLRESRSQAVGEGLGKGEIIAYLVAAASIGGAIIAFIR